MCLLIMFDIFRVRIISFSQHVYKYYIIRRAPSESAVLLLWRSVYNHLCVCVTGLSLLLEVGRGIHRWRFFMPFHVLLGSYSS